MAEQADGGWWYVARAVQAGHRPGWTIDSRGLSGGWCAWYRNVGPIVYAVVRTPDPAPDFRAINLPPQANIPDDLSWPPHGRIRGR